MHRVAIFIDGSNLYHCVRTQSNRTDLDIERLAHKLLGNRQLERIYYYNAPIEARENPEAARAQQRFFDRLSHVRYLQLRLGVLVRRDMTNTCPSCKKTFTTVTFTQKGVDVRLAIDMLSLAVKNRYDTAVVVSGDADVAEAIEAVKELGKYVENAFTTHGWAPQLRQACDVQVRLDEEFLKDCWQER